MEKDYEQLLEKAETADAEEVATICQQLQDLVSQLRPDASVLASAGSTTFCPSPFVVTSAQAKSQFTRR